MPIQVSCTCGKRFRIHAQGGGIDLACPSCQKPVRVPRSPADQSDAEAAPGPRRRKSLVAAILLLLLLCVSGLGYLVVMRLSDDTSQSPIRASLTPAVVDPPILSENPQETEQERSLGVLGLPDETKTGFNQGIAEGFRRADEARTRKQAEDERRQAEERQRVATIERLTKEGRQALQEKRFDIAIARLNEARKLRPEDAALEADILVAKQGHAEANRRKEEEQVRIQVQKLTASGKAKLEAQQFDAAVKELSAALRLSPDAPDLAALHKEAVRAAEEEQARQRAEEQRRQREALQLVARAREAMVARDLEAAASSVKAAAALAPRDSEVLKVQEALRRAQELAHEAEEARRKKEAEFQTTMKAGQAALAARNYDEAIRLFRKASFSRPNDETIRGLIKQAEAGQEKARADALAAQQQKLAAALERGRSALAAKNLDIASQALEEARKLAPRDPDVAAFGKEVDTARQSALETRRKQQLAELEAHMKVGAAAMAGKRYEDAIKAFTAALRIDPTSSAAQTALKDAQKASRDAIAAEAKGGLTKPK